MTSPIDIRPARDDDWPAIWPIYSAIVIAGETYAAAVHLWQSLGFEIVGTVREAFEHPAHGKVGPACDAPDSLRSSR